MQMTFFFKINFFKILNQKCNGMQVFIQKNLCIYSKIYNYLRAEQLYSRSNSGGWFVV